MIIVIGSCIWMIRKWSKNIQENDWTPL